MRAASFPPILTRLARLLLAVGVVFAGLAAPGPRAPDPGYQLARAAGMLCQADPDGAPAAQHAHEHCWACPALGAAGLPASPVTLAMPRAPSRNQPIAPAGIPGAAGRAAYASRAPPGIAA